MQPKLIVAFDRLNNAEFLAKSGFIVNCLTQNVNYSEPWLPQMASLIDLTNAQIAYVTAYQDALSQDKFKITHRNECRAVLTAMLKNTASYCELVAQGDISKLESSGYDLRRETTHTNSYDPLPAPSDFRLTQGAFSGTIDVNISRLIGSASYEVQTTQLDPTVEANWTHALWSSTASHIQLTDLIPGQSYWIRIRGIGSNGVGLWTDPLHIIVV